MGVVTTIQAVIQKSAKTGDQRPSFRTYCTPRDMPRRRMSPRRDQGYSLDAWCCLGTDDKGLALALLPSCMQQPGFKFEGRLSIP